MTAVRRSITDPAPRDRYVQGALALKAEGSAGIRTSEVGITGGPLAADRPLSTWDLFVIWHVWAMQQISSDGRRNAAHMGPVFLPWHRWFLLVIEANMQRVLGVSRDDFGLPYWDWAADGTNLTPAQQRTGAAVWQIIGGNGRASDRQVVDGPFVQASFDVRVEQGPSGALRATNRGLRRNFGVDTSRLPRQADLDQTLANGTYDRAGWDTSASSFRNMAEGWVPAGPAMHNRVHVWVAGDMAPGSSPNDPVFYLNHCFVDRIWESWLATRGRTYIPAGSESTQLRGHRLTDPMHNLLIRQPVTPAMMLDATAYYSYDRLP